MNKNQIGSTIESFLEEEGILEECNKVAKDRIKEYIKFSERMKKYWISVEDELPDYERFVLVFSKNKRISISFYSEHFKIWRNNLDIITHWMPLPEEPK